MVLAFKVALGQVDDPDAMPRPLCLFQPETKGIWRARIAGARSLTGYERLTHLGGSRLFHKYMLKMIALRVVKCNRPSDARHIQKSQFIMPLTEL